MITSSVKETPTDRNGRQNAELHIPGRQTLIHGMFGLADHLLLGRIVKTIMKAYMLKKMSFPQDLFGNRIGMLLLTM